MLRKGTPIGLKYAIGTAFCCALLAAPGIALAQENPPGLPNVDFSSALFEMFLSLALVLGVLVAVLWLVRRFLSASPAMGGGSMRLLSRLSLGQRKYLALVEVAGEVLVLGISNESINLLGKVQDTESLPEMKPMARPQFKSFFKRAQAGGEDQK
jgi:flagellar protein FliO/FliZ